MGQFRALPTPSLAVPPVRPNAADGAIIVEGRDEFQYFICPPLVRRGAASRPAQRYSHSMVAGGFDEMS